MVNVLLPRPGIAWPRTRVMDFAGFADFACCIGVFAASLFGTARLPALALLLGLAVLRHRRLLAPRVLLVATAMAIGWLLRNSGNWYAAHAAFDWLAACTAAASALCATPVSLRQWLANRSPRAIAIIEIAVPAAALFLNANPTIATGDSQPVLPTVVQMLERGNRDLAGWASDGRWEQFTFAGNPYFLRALPGRAGRYSAYPAGMELFALPGVLIAKAAKADLHNAETLLAIERITAALLAAASLAVFYLIAVRFSRPPAAYIATLLLMLGSTFTTTHGIALWQQSGVVFWMLIVLLCETREHRGWLQAFACAAMLACRPSAVTFLIPFGVWTLRRSPRGAMLLAARAIACYAPWAVMYQSLYGSPFGPSMSFLNENWQPAGNLAGVLFSPARGLLVYQPWLLLLLIPAASHPWRPLLLGAIGMHLLLVASWPMWWGGHCWGSRLLAEVVPLAALLMLGPLDRLLDRPIGGWVAGALVALGMVLHLPGSHGSAMAWNFNPESVDADPARLWDWREPPFLTDFRQ